MGEWFVFVMVLKVCMDFGEVILGVQDINSYTFITWFDCDGMYIYANIVRIVPMACSF